MLEVFAKFFLASAGLNIRFGRKSAAVKRCVLPPAVFVSASTVALLHERTSLGVAPASFETLPSD